MNHSFKRRDQVKSPRQVATRAYTLATKKINSDDRRKRHIYHMRERLLIQNTMVSARSVLNNSSSHPFTQSHCKVALSDPYDYIQTALSCSERPKHYPPPPPLLTLVPDCATDSLSDPSNQSGLPNSTSPVVSSSQPSPPLDISQEVIFQWPLFDLLHCPPFIFWSIFFLFVRKGHRLGNSLEKDYLLPTHLTISAPRASQ